MSRTEAQRLRASVLTATALLSASLLAGCAPRGPKLVVLLTVEGMAQQPMAGLETVTLPADLLTVDARASEPIFTPCPVLRPALTSIMTGLPPLEHRVLDNSDPKPAATLPLLAEDFKAHGASTAAFVASPLVSWLGGLERGFELFDGAEGFAFGAFQSYPETRAGSQVVANFVRWLDTRPKDRDAFAWVHLSDPSTAPKVAQGGLEANDAAARVSQLEQALQKLREALRDAKNQPAVLVITSDRVAARGSTGDLGQGFFLDPAWIRVPLVTERFGVDPGWNAPPRPADLTGIAAYVEAMLAVRQGRIPAAKPAGDAVRTVSLSVAPWFWCRWSPAVVAAQGQELWIHDGAWRHAAAAGAGEPAPVEEREVPETVRAHVAGVTEKLSVVPARGPKTLEAVRVAHEHGIEVGADDLVVATPDLATRRQMIETLQRARAAMIQNRPIITMRALKQLAEAQPPVLAGLIDLLLYDGAPTGNRAAAVDVARQVLGAAGAHPIALHWLAHAALGLNERKLAEALLEAYLEVRPGEPDVLYDLACATSMDADMERSSGYLAQAIENGFRHWDLIQNDSDLRALRTDRRFGEVMKSHGR